MPPPETPYQTIQDAQLHPWTRQCYASNATQLRSQLTVFEFIFMGLTVAAEQF